MARAGRRPGVVLGYGLAVVLIAAVTLAGLAQGHQSGLIMLGLFLNDVGWNLAFVAGSALLTDALSPTERTSIQGNGGSHRGPHGGPW